MVLVKSNYNWVVDTFVRSCLRDWSAYAWATGSQSVEHEFPDLGPTRSGPIPMALLISGLLPPPASGLAPQAPRLDNTREREPRMVQDLHFYDTLVYETEWYAPQIEQHARTIHAFGVDTDLIRATAAEMRAREGVGPDGAVAKEWDYMFVGTFTNYKRPFLLANKPGRKLAVGEWRWWAGGLLWYAVRVRM